MPGSLLGTCRCFWPPFVAVCKSGAACPLRIVCLWVRQCLEYYFSNILLPQEPFRVTTEKTLKSPAKWFILIISLVADISMNSWESQGWMYSLWIYTVECQHAQCSYRVLHYVYSGLSLCRWSPWRWCHTYIHTHTHTIPTRSVSPNFGNAISYQWDKSLLQKTQQKVGNIVLLLDDKMKGDPCLIKHQAFNLYGGVEA